MKIEGKRLVRDDGKSVDHKEAMINAMGVFLSELWDVENHVVELGRLLDNLVLDVPNAATFSELINPKVDSILKQVMLARKKVDNARDILDAIPFQRPGTVQ